MSRETSNWLNTMTLIGFTDKRGHAWHYREASQGNEPNHYPAGIPVADVLRRLFNWEACEGTVESTIMNMDGVTHLQDRERKTICRPAGAFGPTDMGAILGVFKQGYTPHQYAPWLIGTVADVLDTSSEELGIGSAGLLKQGAVGWVQVEVPDTIVTPEGVEFRPNLLACTSLDGSHATTFKRTITNVVCDNTMAAGLSEKGQTFKLRHSRYSGFKLQDAKDALCIIHKTADDFAAQVKSLCDVKVSEGDWNRFLESLAPVVNKPEGRSLTMAQNKQTTLRKLYNHDQRVAPWRGTAYGVVQAVNTYEHHEAIVRNASRAERNMLNAINGTTDKLDQSTLDMLQAVMV